MRTIAMTISLLLSTILLSTAFPMQNQPDLPRLTRDSIMATAKLLKEYEWVMASPENEVADCALEYSPYWHVGDTVEGIAYDWGGMDGPEAFERKLESGQGAGSLSSHWPRDEDGNHIPKNCSAGLDCSGFVSFCWGVRNESSKRSTKTLDDPKGGLGERLVKIDDKALCGNGARDGFCVDRDLLPGDALVRPGHHVYLWADYTGGNTPIVYDASSSRRRVDRKEIDWTDLQCEEKNNPQYGNQYDDEPDCYYVIRYKGLVKE